MRVKNKNLGINILQTVCSSLFWHFLKILKLRAMSFGVMLCCSLRWFPIADPCVGYTCRHLHQRIEEHKGSAIGNHLREQHNMTPNDIARSFKILRKCQNKLDCLIFEMLFIKELKPSLNKQCDSIRAKLFV